MDFTGLSSVVIGMLLELLFALVSLVLAPIDLLINAIAPSANVAIGSFFDWVNSMLYSMGDFLDWFLYVLGVTPATWSLIGFCFSALLLTFIIMFPVKLAFNAFRGFKA